MTQYNVNKYHIWYVYSCSIYILYSMYNNSNSNDNKCDAIVCTICAYIHTVRHLRQPTHTQTGWLDRAREDSVAYTYTMRHIAHHSITHTYTYTYIYIYIYIIMYILPIYTYNSR